MGLFKHNHTNKEYNEPERRYPNPKTLLDEEILKILIQSFNIPKELRVEIVERLKHEIKKATNKDCLDYAKLIKNITDGDDDIQKAEFLAHQVLGAYLTYILILGKPLDIELLEELDND
jgi:hypothetical protein